ncbi:MAG: preprotein translocase subunit SecE [Solirubrobacteraceae bacterium]|nr:preprotein translocase subunit SecE [Solirubrobacteraceae bacterium]
MARKRQRAKDRKQKLRRENIPGSLDHVSGEVDRVEAEIVAGSHEPSVDEPYESPFGDGGTVVDDEQLGEGSGDVAAPSAKQKRSGFRVFTFLAACWAELQRVQWPNRRQTGQATAVVLGFVLFAGAFLGIIDVIAQRLIDFIL